jgi:mRNA (guanine-N7-)-methyltransferase
MSEQISTASNDAVVSYYNSKKDTDLKSRSQSRIEHLRNFNNWIKSVLINEFIRKKRNESQNRSTNFNECILDLGCGRGGDIKKWLFSRVREVYFTDIAELSLKECEKRYNQLRQRRKFEAKFFQLDATKQLIVKEDERKDLADRCDLVSSQFVLHYSFESYSQANMFLKNVSDSLKVGGYFIGTTTDAYEIMKRLQGSETNAFGNEIYNIKFYEDSFVDKETKKPKLFGAKFDFQLEGVVNCPEYLVYFPLLVELAAKYKLKLSQKWTFEQFYNKFSEFQEHERLLKTMNALETYDTDTLKSNQIDIDYEHVKNYNYDSNEYELKTLSRSEWEAITLYIVFAFIKIE